jgi:hypothetical protein
MAVLNQWNDTDMAKSTAACADNASVMDDIPPYEWHGATATFALQKTASGWRITGWNLDAARERTPSPQIAGGLITISAAWVDRT